MKKIRIYRLFEIDDSADKINDWVYITTDNRLRLAIPNLNNEMSNYNNKRNLNLSLQSYFLDNI